MFKLSGIVAVAVFLAVFSIPFFYNSLSVGVGGAGAVAPKLVHKKGECVRDTAWMRHNHMQLLMHAREDAVRDGVRVTNHGIKGCRTCHPNRAEFCDQCHGYVGVKLECWDCHYYPAKPEKAA